MNSLKKCRSYMSALAVFGLSLVLNAQGAFAQATPAPSFTDVTDAVDIMDPLTTFVTYAGTVIAVVVGIAFAIKAVKMVMTWLSSLGVAR